MVFKIQNVEPTGLSDPMFLQACSVQNPKWGKLLHIPLPRCPQYHMSNGSANKLNSESNKLKKLFIENNKAKDLHNNSSEPFQQEQEALSNKDKNLHSESNKLKKLFVDNNKTKDLQKPRKGQGR